MSPEKEDALANTKDRFLTLEISHGRSEVKARLSQNIISISKRFSGFQRERSAVKLLAPTTKTDGRNATRKRTLA